MVKVSMVSSCEHGSHLKKCILEHYLLRGEDAYAFLNWLIIHIDRYNVYGGNFCEDDYFSSW